MGKLLLSLIIKYVEAHPDQIVDLMGEATKAGVNALKKHNEATTK
jgi:hypothetical protein